MTKWEHSVEISVLNGVPASPKEQELLDLIREVLQEAEYDLSDSVSLAAGVATTWSWLLQDVSTESASTSCFLSGGSLY